MALSPNLFQRLLSAAIILPVAALLLYVGPPFIYLWMAALIAGMCWEIFTLAKERKVIGIAATLYVILAGIWFTHLGSDGPHATATRFWIVAMAVLGDSIAYFMGRSIGGPKLIPVISPNKTWAGLAGAIIGTSVTGIACSFIFLGKLHLPLLGLSFLLGFVEQAGDLLESWFKRYCGAKDSSGLIPGHGGLLDRLDGALGLVIVLAILELSMGDLLWLWQ